MPSTVLLHPLWRLSTLGSVVHSPSFGGRAPSLVYLPESNPWPLRVARGPVQVAAAIYEVDAAASAEGENVSVEWSVVHPQQIASSDVWLMQ